MTENTPMTPYTRIGGAEAVQQLVTRFYFHMDNLPQTLELRKLHAEDLSDSREKLFKYLSGWLGGPDLFVQAYGHPRLRQRHMHVAISSTEVAQWLLCMEKALAEHPMDPEIRAQLWQALVPLAQHMANH